MDTQSVTPIQLICTDFDGTFHSDHETPPVPRRLESLIGRLQERGAKWVINTGRDLSSLMETLGRAHLSIRPDYLVLVEREIYFHQDSRYLGLEEWNRRCTQAHEELFRTVRLEVPRLVEWINRRFTATIYEDPFSPFCLIADDNRNAGVIYDYLTKYAESVPQLSVVRNDVYARFSHVGYNKGIALKEIAQRLGVSRDHILAAGDHYNDMPMLSKDVARWLVAPSNAIQEVKAIVRQQDGYVSDQPWGHGLALGLEFWLGQMLALA